MILIGLIGFIGITELLVVLFATVLPLLGIIWLIRYLIQSHKDRCRLRLEVGRLADEVQQLQQSSQHKNDDQHHRP